MTNENMVGEEFRAREILYEAIQQMEAEGIPADAAVRALAQMFTDFVACNAPGGKRVIVRDIQIYTEECPDGTPNRGYVN